MMNSLGRHFTMDIDSGSSSYDYFWSIQVPNQIICHVYIYIY